MHAGDFAFCRTREEAAERYIKKLNGKHIFLFGSHDTWMGAKRPPNVYHVKIDKNLIVVCHYALRVWPRRHYGSWHLYGHSHGNLEPQGLSMDVGVDCHDFYPVSHRQLKEHFSE